MASININKTSAATSTNPRPGHTKTTSSSSSTDVSKLLTKLAPPNLPTKLGASRTLPALSTAGRAANAGIAASASSSVMRKTASQAFKPSTKTTNSTSDGTATLKSALKTAASTSNLQTAAAGPSVDAKKEKGSGLGKYDDGLEDDEAPPVEEGDAADELALNSSTAG